MRTRMNYAPGYGASPSSHMEFDLDGFTAGQMLGAAQRIRQLTEQYAADVAREISANDLWDDHRPESDEARAARFKAALEELVDEQLHQGKLEEAGEVA